MKKFEREFRLFFEIFGLAALPGMLHAFIINPSITTLPDAYFALSTYAIYRLVVTIREEFEKESDMLDKKLDPDKDKKEILGEKRSRKEVTKEFDHKP